MVIPPEGVMKRHAVCHLKNGSILTFWQFLPRSLIKYYARGVNDVQCTVIPRYAGQSLCPV